MFEEGARSSCLQDFYTRNSDIITASHTFQLIAVTDSASCPRALPAQVKRMVTCAHKPAKLILRAKELSLDAYAALAREILPLCHQHGIELILHTHWELAQELGLSSVHMPLPLLAQMPDKARHSLHISTSVHSASEAEQALQLGVKALIAGHIYATNCKAGVPPRGLAFLRSINEICVRHTTPLVPSPPANLSTANTCSKIYASTPIPVYAIGGIGFAPAQWQELEQNGASGACIMSAYMRL